jgi:hypothetical protein
MSSLVYITRIQPFSAELARALESSGFHVKTFRPGEITADECVLVMTSEAVLAGLRLSGVAALTGADAAKGTKSRSVASLQDIQKHLGAESDIWNRIKAAGITESVAGISAAVPSQSALVVPTSDSVDFIASQARTRVFAASQQQAAAANSGSSVPGLPAHLIPKAIEVPEPLPIAQLKKARPIEIRKPGGGRHRPFWQPAALAVGLLICALVLLTGGVSIIRPTADVAAVDDSDAGVRSGSSVVGRVHRGSTQIRSTQIRSTQTRPTQSPNHLETSTKSSDVAAEGGRRVSEYDFVAEDFTTRFDPHGRTVQTPDPGHRAPGRLVPKRIVVN